MTTPHYYKKVVVRQGKLHYKPQCITNHFCSDSYLLFCCICTVLFANLSALGQGDLVSRLTEKDCAFRDGEIAISFLSSTTVNKFEDPNQGTVFRKCRVSLKHNRVVAMHTTYYYEHLPVYGKPGTKRYKPLDYDKEGSLVVWRKIEEYVLSNEVRNDALEIIQPYYVKPDGAIVEGVDKTTIFYLGQVGSSDNLHIFNQFQMAVGRGLSEHLKLSISTEMLPSGLARVTAQGSYGPGLQGTWIFNIDPNAGHLVRQAVFNPEGSAKETVFVESEGFLAKDGIEIAQRGIFRYANFLELSFEVVDIAPLDKSDELYAEVLSRIEAPLPMAAGTKIIDLRSHKTIRPAIKRP